MMTMRELMKSYEEVAISPDGIHWEPALPEELWTLRRRLRDAWLVFTGRATAIMQTPVTDVSGRRQRLLQTRREP